MPRSFHTTGPCDVRKHYMLPAESLAPDLPAFLAQEVCFVLHGPRRSGKTTAIRSDADRLRAGGTIALVASLDGSLGEEQVESAEAQWIDAVQEAAWILPEGDRPPARQPMPSSGLRSHPVRRVRDAPTGISAGICYRWITGRVTA